MPDRLIRDELLRSPRYRTLSSDTSRLLFIHLLLCVDNLGNYEANSIAIGDAMKRHMDDPTVAKLLAELADVDIIRLYQVDGKPYLHIPRFRQRLKYLGSKHPRPQPGIECIETKQLVEEYRLKAGHRQPKGSIEANEEKRSEVKRSEVKINPTGVPNSVARAPIDGQDRSTPDLKDFSGQHPTPKPKLVLMPDWHRSNAGIDHTAALLGLQAKPGEEYPGFKDRCFQEIYRREREEA